ncbi:MAG: hypothetical protein PUG21_02020 [Prevotella sp.]|nr:hypothetical protein [Prevotella sp.]
MSNYVVKNYVIADFPVRISFSERNRNDVCLLPSFSPFLHNDDEVMEALLFNLIVDNATTPVEKARRERVRAFDTGNGDTIVDRIVDGGWQFIVKDINGKECALLIANSDFTKCRCALKGNYSMRHFGLNNVIMLIFAFAGSKRDTVLIHASLVRKDGWGYAFIAKSGTGKSTQVSMWLRHIPGCDLMNDDNPIIRIIDGKPYIYGSPWSGKTPCYRNVKARLGAVTRIDRAQANSIDKLKPVEAFVSVLPSCSSMKWDTYTYNSLCDIVTRIVETTDIYILHCLPDKESAIICHDTISKNQ